MIRHDFRSHTHRPLGSWALAFSFMIPFMLCAPPAMGQSADPAWLSGSGAQFDTEAASTSPVHELDRQMNSGLTFIENRGQWDAEARYLVRVGGMNAWVTDAGLVFDFYERQPPDRSSGIRSPESLLRSSGPVGSSGPDVPTRGHVVRMHFENIRASHVSGQDRKDGYHNYFLGNDRSRWATGVPLYREVMVTDLYDGIGMRLYEDDGFLRYDFVTEPAADISQIRLRLVGAGGVRITPEGDLAMETSLGEVRQAGLFAYQKIDGRQTAVPASFRLVEDGVVGFKVEPLDASLPVVIDPLIYSTFLGGSVVDGPSSIAVDGSGHAYVAGVTASPNFPTTTGVYEQTQPGTASAFVTKLTPDGSGLVFSTYLGGSSFDQAAGIAVDGTGHAYVTGATNSTNFPTENPFQANPGGFSAFVTKLAPDGSALVFSTYLGGSNVDEAHGIAVDGTGHAYVTGFTNSTNFPTEAPFQASNPGQTSAFVTRLAPDGSALVFSTYLGGSSVDEARGIAVDGTGHAYVTGATNSTNFPTEAPFQASNPGQTSAFVTRLAPDGSDLVFSTYLGGSDFDEATGIAVGGSGHAYVTGSTGSGDFPTEAPFQTSNPGQTSAFVTRLVPDGSAFVFSTYLGGSSFDQATGIAVDGTGHAYVSGTTSSGDFPTEASFQASKPGDFSVFVVKLESSGSGLVFSTYLGGSAADLGEGVAVNGSAHAYVTGLAFSADFPTTGDAFETVHPGSISGFVAKLQTPVDSCADPVTVPFWDSNITSNNDGSGFFLVDVPAGFLAVALVTEDSDNITLLEPWAYNEAAGECEPVGDMEPAGDGRPPGIAAHGEGNTIWDYTGGDELTQVCIRIANEHAGESSFMVRIYDRCERFLQVDPLIALGRDVAELPSDFLLEANYPNPFNPSTTIRFHLPQSADVLLTVYDVVGREVRRIAAGHHDGGVHTVQWDGRNESGAAVASGVYVYRIRAAGFTSSRAMLLMK